MTGFLEPHEVDRLGKAWSDIASLAPQLEDVIATNVIGTPSSLGIRIAHAPASRPPVNLAAIECLNLLHVCVTGWVRCLLDDALVEIPADTSTRGLARHLHVNADQIAHCAWAVDCLAEVEDLAAQAQRIVEPPKDLSITDRYQITESEVRAQAYHAEGEAADMVVVHKAVTGEELTVTRIHQWRRRGKLPPHLGPVGQPWYHYFEIAAVIHESKRRPRPQRGYIADLTN